MMRALWIANLLFLVACGQSGNVASLPLAEAGFDRVVPVNTDVRLDGSGSSDPGGASLTYDWRLVSQPGDSSAELVAETTVEPRLRPDVPGNYLVSLVVSNPNRDSEPDRVAIRATGIGGNVAPVADADCDNPACGGDGCPTTLECWVGHGSTASLDGRSSSDANDDDLSYEWVQVLPSECATECPGLTECATIAEAVTDLGPSPDERVWDYTAPPHLTGRLNFKLTVDDGELTDTSGCIFVEVINFAPTAIVGQDPTSALEDVAFSLDGLGGDNDPPDQGNLTFAWTHEPAGVAVAYAPSATVEDPSVTVSGLTEDTDVSFVLTVTDSAANGSAQESSVCEISELPACDTNCCGIVVPIINQ